MVRDKKFHFIEGLKSGVFVSALFAGVAAVVVGGIASVVIGAPAVLAATVGACVGGALGAFGAYVGAETSMTGNSKVAFLSGLATTAVLSACLYGVGSQYERHAQNDSSLSPRTILTRIFKSAAGKPVLPSARPPELGSPRP